MSAREEIHKEIVARQKSISEHEFAIAALDREIAAERAAIAREREEIEALERAQAVLDEHKPAPAPAPVASRTKTTPKTPNPSGRFSRDPLSVGTRQGGRRRDVGQRAPVTPVSEGGGLTRLDINNPSPTVEMRADLVEEILREHGGELSQRQIAVELGELMDCDNAGTAQKMTSELVAFLHYNDRVKPTGEKGEDRLGRLVSPIWRIVEEVTA